MSLIRRASSVPERGEDPGSPRGSRTAAAMTAGAAESPDRLAALPTSSTQQKEPTR
ncbi:hypothetical protein [Actinoalloteichus sp. GBA129-24]|uniref:hypothetical protein n=1 Tax=Actinoalloteichus sp. GBA129-24 TaxID=1612551 RepID=UPI0009505EBC|nr:hypothetical protein [Actinoalloteichus sp. GBA129-24]APU19115.1 hypothetical protein UA75_05445 [Actinoalloteichus sp. GBA129-24]